MEEEAPEMNKSDRKRLTLTYFILIIAAFVGIAFVVWLAWVRPAMRDREIDSFQACVEAGNPVQDSYPEVCVTESGKRFENPSQAE